MPIADIMIVLVFCDAITSNGFSSSPKSALYIGSSRCSKPKTLPKKVPNTADEIPQGNRILPIFIFFSFHIRSPAIERHIPCPKSANIIPKIMM